MSDLKINSYFERFPGSLILTSMMPESSWRSGVQKQAGSSLFMSSNKKVELFEGAGVSEPVAEDNVQLASSFALSVLPTESRSVKREAIRQLTGSVVKAGGLRFAVVVARFNELVTKLLLEGALDTFKKYSVNEEDIDVVWVPGSFEIGITAQILGKSGKYHAVLCIGAVVKGDTSHYDAVVNSATSGVLSAGLNSGVPCIFGVLTCDDMDQALNRAGGKAGNKGSETALTAIEMASLFEHHLKQ